MRQGRRGEIYTRLDERYSLVNLAAHLEMVDFILMFRIDRGQQKYYSLDIFAYHNLHLIRPIDRHIHTHTMLVS